MAEIIIPVYNAAGEFADCLDRLKRHTPPEVRVTLADDGSTDKRIGEMFRELSKSHDRRWHLVRNPRNLGYVRTANRVMAAGGDDVILLNSDTLPTEGWYERIVTCAASDDRIATVTPFSNNAEICSFPDFCKNNPVPEDPERVARAMREAGPPEYPELPTGVGFCLFIRREALKRLGLFDARFGRGYGEENDFCMRARQAGWRNVLCDDAFVVHLGGRSFSQFGLAPKGEDAMTRLRARHPDYERLVAEFIERDPLAPRREAIQRALAARENAPERDN